MSPIHRLLSTGILLVVMLITFGTTAAAEEQVQVIEVKPGDELNNLCAEYLSDPAKCTEIADYNKLKDPNRIAPGEKIRIPISYLKLQPLVGNVTFVKGDCQVQREDAGAWGRIALSDKVHFNNKVRTGAKSSLELSFEDGSVLLLRDSAEMTINVLERRKDGFFKRFFLSAGRLLSKTVKQGAASRTEIATHTAVAGVRGTKFDLVVLEDLTTRAVVQEGAISVSAMGKDVEVHAGEGTLVRQGMPPEEPRKVLAAPAPIDLQAKYTSLPVQVRYSPVEGSAGYHVLLTRDRDGRDAVLDTTLAPGMVFTVLDLESGTYFLQVRSIDSQGLEGMEGEPSVVLVQIEPKAETPPPAPAPIVKPEPQVEKRGMLEAVLGVIFVIAVFLM